MHVIILCFHSLPLLQNNTINLPSPPTNRPNTILIICHGDIWAFGKNQVVLLPKNFVFNNSLTSYILCSGTLVRDPDSGNITKETVGLDRVPE